MSSLHFQKSDQPPFIPSWVLWFIVYIHCNQEGACKQHLQLKSSLDACRHRRAPDIFRICCPMNKSVIQEKHHHAKSTNFQMHSLSMAIQHESVIQTLLNPLSLSIKTSYHRKGWHPNRPHNQSGCWNKQSIDENINDKNSINNHWLSQVDIADLEHL